MGHQPLMRLDEIGGRTNLVLTLVNIGKLVLWEGFPEDSLETGGTLGSGGIRPTSPTSPKPK